MCVCVYKNIYICARVLWYLSVLLSVDFIPPDVISLVFSLFIFTMENSAAVLFILCIECCRVLTRTRFFNYHHHLQVFSVPKVMLKTQYGSKCSIPKYFMVCVFTFAATHSYTNTCSIYIFHITSVDYHIFPVLCSILW